MSNDQTSVPNPMRPPATARSIGFAPYPSVLSACAASAKAPTHPLPDAPRPKVSMSFRRPKTSPLRPTPNDAVPPRSSGGLSPTASDPAGCPAPARKRSRPVNTRGLSNQSAATGRSALKCSVCAFRTVAPLNTTPASEKAEPLTLRSVIVPSSPCPRTDKAGDASRQISSAARTERTGSHSPHTTTASKVTTSFVAGSAYPARTPQNGQSTQRRRNLPQDLIRIFYPHCGPGVSFRRTSPAADESRRTDLRRRRPRARRRS